MSFLRVFVDDESVKVGEQVFPRSPDLVADVFDYEVGQLREASRRRDPSSDEKPPKIPRHFLEAFGHKLLHTLLPTDEARAAVAGDRCLALDLAEDLAPLPWELMQDGRNFLALKPGIVRVVESSAELQPGVARGLLAALTMPVLDPSEPADSHKQPYIADVRGHANMLRKAASECPLPVTVRRHVTARLFRKALDETKPGVVYLLAHGSRQGLLFEEPDWTCDPVKRKGVIRWLTGAGTQIVVLNSCLTGAETKDAQAIAADIVAGGVPIVVGMQFPIGIDAAEAFAPGFLGRLRPQEDAAHMLAAAREDVYEEHGERVRSWEFATPVMFVSSAVVDSEQGAVLPEEAVQQAGVLSDPDWERVAHLTNLPARFVGRREELVEVAQGLEKRKLTIVYGARGVGKTALAQEAAIRAAKDFERVVWVSGQVHEVPEELEPLRAGTQMVDRPESADDVIARLAERLGSGLGRDAPLPDLLHDCTLLAGQGQPLIVLDNLDTVIGEPAIRQLLADLPESCRVLATCFRQPGGWPTVPLSEPVTNDAIELALLEARQLGLEVAPRDLGELIRTVGRHPLTIRLVLGQAAEGTRNLQQVLGDMRERKGELLPYVLGTSLELAGPEGQRLLALASVFPVTVPRAILRQASGLSQPEFDKTFTSVVRLALLEFDPNGKEARVPELVRLGILEAADADTLVQLVKGVRRVERTASAELFCDAASALEAHCRGKGAVKEWLPLGRAALGRARSARDERLVALAASNLALGLRRIGELDEGLVLFGQAYAIGRKLRDEAGQASCLGNMGLIHARRGELHEALRCHQKAYNIAERLSNPQTMGTALGNMGLIHRRRGDLDEALRCHQEAYEIGERLNNPQRRANQVGNMGLIHRRRGDLDEALRCHQEAYDIAQQLKNPQTMANQLGNMGLIHADRGELDEALRCHQEAYEIGERLNNPQTMANQLSNVANIHAAKGDLQQALRCYNEAYEIAERLGAAEIMADQLARMGLLNLRQGKAEEARGYLQRARTLYDKHGYRGPNRDLVEETLRELGVGGEEG